MILYWLVGCLDVGASLLLQDMFPSGLQGWQAESAVAPAGFGEWLLRGWILVILLALVAGSLGVFRRRQWGRWGFAAANLVMFASYPLLEVMIYSWLGGLLADLSMVLTGAILLACFGPGSAAIFRRPDQPMGASGA